MQKASRDLPTYTRGEEIFNAVSHIVGGGFGIIALITGVLLASLDGDIYKIISMSVYGVSMILLYTMSALYHFLKPIKAKKVFRIFDHCTIFLLIAGTYTPFCLVTLRNCGFWGYGLLIAVWSVSIMGITLNAINMYTKASKTISMICYLLLGWCIILAIKPLVDNLSMAGFLLLLAGGLMYTIGAVFYGIGAKKKYIHSVWHLFVLAGTVLQFFSIIFYVII